MSEKHQQQAREVTRGTSVETKLPITDAALIWDKIAAALEAVERDTARRCAEIAGPSPWCEGHGRLLP